VKWKFAASCAGIEAGFDPTHGCEAAMTQKLTQTAIVTVRSTSTRLPGKVSKIVWEDKSAVEIVLARAALTGLPVIMATSTDPSDDGLAAIGEKAGYRVYRGDLLNKFHRWLGCYRAFGTEHALLVDGDDLAYDFDIGRRALDLLQTQHLEIVKHPEDIVCGYFTYAVSLGGMEKLAAVAPAAGQNVDVIVEYIKKAGLTEALVPLKEHECGRNFRLTLDYEEDLEMFRALYRGVKPDASGEEISRYLDNHPEVVNINLHRQAMFLENQARANQMVRDSV
jgi:spore coat polysaccharide biosynthesis protein SpsF